MSVKRYDFSCSTLNGLFVEQYDDGDYVTFDDYAALLSRHNALWNFYEQLEHAMYEFEKEARMERMKRVAVERFRESYKEIAANAVKQNDALREAVHKAMGRTALCDKKQTDGQLIADISYLNRLASDYFKTSVDCGNRAFAAEQKYDALREAVEWDLECRDMSLTDLWFDEFNRTEEQSKNAVDELCATMDAARAEVDRLLEGEE